jgi:DNA-binding transcriptional LysR family regulator
VTFDIRQLRYAIAAADHGSFYRAARALDVDQSTLSRNIAKLERTIGADLFARSRAGVTTTIAGVQFLRAARPMVASADKMIAATRSAGQGHAGSLTIGLNSPVSAGNLRATLLAWEHDHPDVDLDGVEADRSTLLAGLNTGEIDVAILLGDVGFSGYRREVFWSERFLAALPADHPLADCESVQWTDLRYERFALPALDSGPDIRDTITGRLALTGLKLNIRMFQISREAILSLLGDGGWVSVVCEGSTGTRYPDVIYRPIYGEQGPALAVYSGYWRDDNENPPLKRFLAFVRKRYALSFDFPL